MDIQCQSATQAAGHDRRTRLVSSPGLARQRTSSACKVLLRLALYPTRLPGRQLDPFATSRQQGSCFENFLLPAEEEAEVVLCKTAPALTLKELGKKVSNKLELKAFYNLSPSYPPTPPWPGEKKVCKRGSRKEDLASSPVISR